MLSFPPKKFQAIAARDAMAKCLYGSLFDWIVMQLNHALLAKKDADKMQRAYSIGVLDIFGFEDFGNMNRYALDRNKSGRFTAPLTGKTRIH